MTKRDQLIKLRASGYEKALLKLLTEKANTGANVLTESDVVRIAIADMANKYLSAAEFQQLKNEYEV